MIKTSERVKTLSIIDTISELAKNENEASRLTLPSPISNNKTSPRKHSTPTKISGNVSQPKFQNGNQGPNSPIMHPSLVNRANDSSRQHSLQPPPLISPSTNGSQSSPMVPNFTLYEIDQKQNHSTFLSSTPTSPLLKSNEKSNRLPLSPFSGGARSKLGSLRIIRGSSQDHASHLTPDPIRKSSFDTSTKTENHIDPHNSSETKYYPNKVNSSSSSVPFGKNRHQPFVTLDSASGIIETKNGKIQTPDWIRDIFQHAKRGNREKLVSFSYYKGLDGILGP